MFAVGLLSACKPTEKNYQAAYQAAQNKRKADAAVDPDMALPANAIALQSLDGPLTKEIGGERLKVKHMFIKYVGKGEAPEIKRVNVAVAKYKMPTNAVAQTEDLVAKGFPAFPVESADGSFYVIVSTFHTYEEAAAFVKEYRKKHDSAAFVGIDGEPLLIER